MKKIKLFTRSMAAIAFCFMLTTVMLCNPLLTAYADSEEGNSEEQTIVTLGADLSSSDRATVLRLLELTEEDLNNCKVLEITNQDEHDYLDDYLSSSVIGKRALSSIKLEKANDGTGIHVTTQNINYCTESMYVNALATAGIEDAAVTVAGPFEISGTAALVGVMKAYEELTGEDISEDVKDAATDELVTTGEISDSIDDSEKASELIGYIKNQVVSKGVTSESDIEDIVEQAAEEMDINLKDEDVDKIVASMKKISKLDLDVDSLKEQAQGLYDKLNNMDLNIDTEQAKNFFHKFLDFFKKIYDKIINAFS